MTSILRIADVERRVGLRRSAIYLRMSRGQFPKSIALDGTATGWVDAEIEQWIQERIAASRNPSK